MNKKKVITIIVCIVLICAVVLIVKACDNGEWMKITLNGKTAHFGKFGKFSDLPAPYYTSEIKEGPYRTEWDAKPFYGFALRRGENQNIGDANVAHFTMIGGEPNDMIYCGVTFGQTREEAERLLSDVMRSKYEVVKLHEQPQSMREVLAQHFRNWRDEDIVFVEYQFPGFYYLTAIYYNNEVYGMKVSYNNVFDSDY